MVKEKEVKKKAPPRNRPPSPTPDLAVGGNAPAGLSSTPGRLAPVQRLLARSSVTPRRDSKGPITPKRTKTVKGHDKTPVRGQGDATPVSREARLGKLQALERVLTYSQRPASEKSKARSRSKIRATTSHRISDTLSSSSSEKTSFSRSPSPVRRKVGKSRSKSHRRETSTDSEKRGRKRHKSGHKKNNRHVSKKRSKSAKKKAPPPPSSSSSSSSESSSESSSDSDSDSSSSEEEVRPRPKPQIGKGKGSGKKGKSLGRVHRPDNSHKKKQKKDSDDDSDVDVNAGWESMAAAKSKSLLDSLLANQAKARIDAQREAMKHTSPLQDIDVSQQETEAFQKCMKLVKKAYDQTEAKSDAVHPFFAKTVDAALR